MHTPLFHIGLSKGGVDLAEEGSSAGVVARGVIGNKRPDAVLDFPLLHNPERRSCEVIARMCAALPRQSKKTLLLDPFAVEEVAGNCHDRIVVG
jgi:hypothetical protein